MPRMRTIKPEYGTSEPIAAMSIPCRLHFAILWTYVDDEGRGVDNPRLIKAAVWPLDDEITADVVESLQEELACHGRIVRYTNDGRALFEIVGFKEHQRPNRPSGSALPRPDDAGSFRLPRSDHCPGASRSLHPHCWLTPVGEGRVTEGSSLSSAGGSRPDPTATFAAAVEIVIDRRDKRTEATTKSRPNAWLHSARQGIADELRAAGADRAALDGATEDDLAALIEPPPPPGQPVSRPDPHCEACEGNGMVDSGDGYVRCPCQHERHLRAVDGAR